MSTQRARLEAEATHLRHMIEQLDAHDWISRPGLVERLEEVLSSIEREPRPAGLREERTAARAQSEQSDALFASIRQIVGHRDQSIEMATRMAIQARDVTIRNLQEEIERLTQAALSHAMESANERKEFSKEVERLTALVEKSR